MDITVKLFATLRDGRFSVQTMPVAPDARLGDVLDAIDIAEEDLAILLVNGLDAEPGRPLKEGDVISLFPPLGGG